MDIEVQFYGPSIRVVKMPGENVEESLSVINLLKR